MQVVTKCVGQWIRHLVHTGQVDSRYQCWLVYSITCQIGYQKPVDYTVCKFIYFSLFWAMYQCLKINNLPVSSSQTTGVQVINWLNNNQLDTRVKTQ